MCRTSASAAPRAYVSSWACTGDTSRAKRSFACKTQAAFAREDTDTLGRISDRRLRYSLVDAMVERGCTRVVDGELN